jgi:hypothetical protein
MTDYEAIGICEGFIDCENEQPMIDEWQHLIDTKLAWALQGSFGRMARNLIEQGICTE